MWFSIDILYMKTKKNIFFALKKINFDYTKKKLIYQGLIFSFCLSNLPYNIYIKCLLSFKFLSLKFHHFSHIIDCAVRGLNNHSAPALQFHLQLEQDQQHSMLCSGRALLAQG